MGETMGPVGQTAYPGQEEQWLHPHMNEADHLETLRLLNLMDGISADDAHMNLHDLRMAHGLTDVMHPPAAMQEQEQVGFHAGAPTKGRDNHMKICLNVNLPDWMKPPGFDPLPPEAA